MGCVAKHVGKLGALIRVCFQVHEEACGGVVEWLRRSVSNLVGSACVGSNPIVGATNHKPTAYSAVHPSEAGK